jgi:hypothetical protein
METADEGQPLSRNTDKDLSMGLVITVSVKMGAKLLDPIRGGFDVVRACSEPSVRVEFIGSDEQRCRYRLEVVPLVPLPGAML